MMKIMELVKMAIAIMLLFSSSAAYSAEISNTNVFTENGASLYTCKVAASGSSVQHVSLKVSSETSNISYPELYDDGTHGDKAAGDAIYSLKVAAFDCSDGCTVVFSAVDTTNSETESEPLTLF